jgi:hypothetical protein
MPNMTRHGHRHPCVPGSRYLSVGIHPTVVWHSNSIKGIHIICMITLTVDKYTLLKASFST